MLKATGRNLGADRTRYGGLYWDGFRHHPFACEGGHADFAPRNEIEMICWSTFRKNTAASAANEFSRGRGSKIFTTFCATRKRRMSPSGCERRWTQRRPPALISQLAMEGKAAICDQALIDLRWRFRGGDRQLCPELHVHRGNFYRRQHRGENCAQDERACVHAILPGQRPHGIVAERHAGQNRAQRRLRHNRRSPLHADPKSICTSSRAADSDPRTTPTSAVS